jgi:hypothetical protein
MSEILAVYRDRPSVNSATHVVSRTITRGSARRLECYWINDGPAPIVCTVFAIVGKNFIYPNEVQGGGAVYYYRLNEAIGAATVANSGSAGGTAVNYSGLSRAQPYDPIFGAADGSVVAGQVQIASGNVIAHLNIWAVEAWINSPMTARNSFYQEFSPGLSNQLQLWVDSSRQITLTSQVGASVATLTSGNAITANAWHHVIVQNNAGTVTFYADGAVLGTNAYAQQTFLNSNLARHGDSSAGMEIAAPAVYRNTFFADTVTQHYQDGLTATNLAQIDTFTVAASGNKATVYGAGTAIPLPEDIFITFTYVSGDTHMAFVGEAFK